MDGTEDKAQASGKVNSFPKGFRSQAGPLCAGKAFHTAGTPSVSTH